jgi:hypothetical protein
MQSYRRFVIDHANTTHANVANLSPVRCCRQYPAAIQLMGCNVACHFCAFGLVRTATALTPLDLLIWRTAVIFGTARGSVARQS